MLSKLFISKVRIKMLNQFLFNRKEEYHVRGLVRILEEEINAVRRELQNLESAGILISQKKGNKLFYRVDQKNIYLDELTKLLYKDRDDIQQIHKELSKIQNIKTAVLTENYLSNEYPNEHDIDLLILGTDIDVQILTEALKKLEETLDKELRVTMMKPEDIEFQHKKRDDFLLNILRGDKIMLIGHEKDLI